MKKRQAVVAWVVYRSKYASEDGPNAVCEQAEWDAMELADPGFELFSRAAPVRAVGLAVVKLLVEQSGGSLAMDSAEGRGTTFVAVLPRYDVDDYLE